MWAEQLFVILLVSEVLIHTICIVTTIAANHIAEIVKLLQQGAIVAIPTDTVYGLAAMPTLAAKQKIFQLKHRSTQQPLSLLVDSKQTLQSVICWTDQIKTVLQQAQQRSVTVVSYGRCDWPFFNVVQHHGLIGARITNSSWLQTIIRQTGPILATSINVSGQPPLQKLSDIVRFGCDKVVVNCPDPMTNQPSPVYNAVTNRWQRH